eukprot:scaffold5662_cov149-Isochrysis_galbana.AAC.6
MNLCGSAERQKRTVTGKPPPFAFAGKDEEKSYNCNVPSRPQSMGSHQSSSVDMYATQAARPRAIRCMCRAALG